MNLKSYYIPELFRRYFEFWSEETATGFTVEHARFKPEFFGEGYKIFEEYAGNILQKITCDEIMTHLDAVSEKFADPCYVRRIIAVEAVSKATGFSVESCARSIDLEFASSRMPEMAAALRNEFGDYTVLDGFIKNDNLKGYTKAIPNSPVFAVCSSNIPALPHLSIMRAFMTKNALILKTSSQEPFFTPLYMDALADVGSALAECAIVVCYKSAEHSITDKILERAKTVVAYGGIETESYFSKKVVHPKKLIMHSHKLGFGVIGKDFIGCMNSRQLSELAAKIVFDAATFEQRACLAPHVYFYNTSGNPDIDEFARYLIVEFEKEEKKMPPAALDPAQSYRRRSFIDSQIFSDSVESVFESGSKRSAVILGSPKDFPVSPLNRTLFLVPFVKNGEVVARLTPLSGYFQNASLNVVADGLAFWLEELPKLGVSRICPAGHMPKPTMMWHHDGMPALAEMVRFIDIEVFDSNAFKL